MCFQTACYASLVQRCEVSCCYSFSCLGQAHSLTLACTLPRTTLSHKGEAREGGELEER